MKIKISGWLDTEKSEITIDRMKPSVKRGRKSDPAGKSAALVLADAWATQNFTDKPSQKHERINRALPRERPYADDATLRRAIRNAKDREAKLFKDPHKPGEIIFAAVGAVWFSDRATHYKEPVEEMIGYAWVWQPGMPEAVFTIAKVSKGA